MTARERLNTAIPCLRAAAWDGAVQYVAFLRKYGRDDYGQAREMRAAADAYLTALFYLRMTPDGQQYEVNDLIGAVAWVAGETLFIEALWHHLPGSIEQRRAA